MCSSESVLTSSVGSSESVLTPEQLSFSPPITIFSFSLSSVALSSFPEISSLQFEATVVHSFFIFTASDVTFIHSLLASSVSIVKFKHSLSVFSASTFSYFGVVESFSHVTVSSFNVHTSSLLSCSLTESESTVTPVESDFCKSEGSSEMF